MTQFNGETKEFNIQPTRDGYARMADLFRESIKRHEADRKTIEALMLNAFWFTGYGEKQLPDEQAQLIMDGLDMLWNDRGKAVRELQRSIDDITAYLAQGEDK